MGADVELWQSQRQIAELEAGLATVNQRVGAVVAELAALKAEIQREREYRQRGGRAK